MSSFVGAALNIAQFQHGIPAEFITLTRPFYHIIAKRVATDYPNDKKKAEERVTKAVERGVERISTWYDNAPLFGTLAATTLLMALHLAFAQAAARSVGLARLLEGSAIELGRDGALDASALRRHSVSGTDIQEALRQSEVEHVGQTRRLVLEPGGRISVLRC